MHYPASRQRHPNRRAPLRTRPDYTLPPTHVAAHKVDYVHFAVAVTVLLFLAAALLGYLAAIRPLVDTGLFLFAFIGIGTAPLQRLSACTGYQFLSYGIGLSVATVLLVGFGLAELRIWGAAPYLFLLIVVPSAGSHLLELRSALWPIRHRPFPPRALPPFFSRPRWALVSTSGAVLCLVSALVDRNLDPGPKGLLGSLSPAWYFGLVLIVAPIAAYRYVSSSQLAYSAILLQLVLGSTSVIVFPEPLYSWTARQVGITSYVIAHGSVNSNIDIFQAWPGFFAGVAWLCTITHISSPLAIARWFPALLDLGLLIAFRHLADRVGLTPRRAWLATTLFCAGDVVGQNYFSPQSAAYLLALIVFSAAFRSRTQPTRLSIIDVAVLVMCLAAIAVTHQLTPYMITGALFMLAVFGYIKARVLVLLSLMPAIVWAGLNFRYVKEFISPNAFGNIASNIAPPGHLYPNYHDDLSIHLSVAGQVVGFLPICLLAGLVFLARLDRLSLMLGSCAATGLGLVVVSAYGQEGLLRIVLFGLPWMACLAALEPVRGYKHLLNIVSSASIPVMVLGYLFAVMGLDYYYAVRPDDITVVETFERSAPAGSSLITIGEAYMPTQLTPRYSEFPLYDYPDVFASGDILGHFNANLAVRTFTTYVTSPSSFTYCNVSTIRCYAITGEEPRAQLASVGLATVAEYNAFSAALSRSPDWRAVATYGHSALFRLVTP